MQHMENILEDMEVIQSVVPALQLPGIELESVRFDEDQHGLDCVWLTFTLARTEPELSALASKIKDFSYSVTTRLLEAGVQAYPYTDYRLAHPKPA